MIKREPILLSNPQLKKQLEWKAFWYLERKLGVINEQNKQSHETLLRDAKELYQKQEEQYLPKGNYVFQPKATIQIPQIREAIIQAQFEFTLVCPELTYDTLMEQMLNHLLQVSWMDSVRDYLKETVFPALIRYYCKEEPKEISPCFGPGLYDAPIEEKERWEENSFVGVFFSTQEKLLVPYPCSLCKATVGCEFCMINNKRI